MKVEFTVPGEPQGKGRARAYRKGNHIGHYTPEKTANYENFIRLCYLEATSGSIQRMSEKPINLSMVAHMSIPTSYSAVKRKRALEGQIKPLKKPDVDNVAKCVCDALNKIAYTDDKNVVEISVKKVFGTEPRLQIIIEEVN